MKKIKKSIATFIAVIFIVGTISILTYSLIAKPIIYGYEKYGLEGIVSAIVAELIVYTVIFFIIKLIAWAIDTACE